MASNGSVSVKVTSWDTLKFTWSMTSQNVLENSSTIEWVLSLISGSSGRIDSSVQKSWGVTIDGKAYSGKNSVDIANNKTLTLASGSTVIKHDSSKPRTFKFAFTQEFNIVFSGEQIGTITGEGSGELDAIFRATIPTLSTDSADMGTTITINTPSESETYTHNISYRFGNRDWESIATGVKDTTDWEIPLELANVIPHKINGIMVIRCATMNGEDLVGEKDIAITIKVPDSVIPSIGAITVTEATSGIAAQFGAYVQHKSKIKVQINTATAYSSPIESCVTTFDGQKYEGTSWTSEEILKSGELTLVTTLTDARGRTNKRTTTITVEPYAPPKIEYMEVARCDSSGKVKADGELARVRYKFTAPSVGGGNSVQVQVHSKLTSATSYGSARYTGTVTATTGGVVTEDTARLFGGASPFELDKQYDIKLTIKDWFGATATYVGFLPSDDVILDISADGKGISFFEFCEQSGVTIRGGIPRTPIVLNQADLNTVKEPGFYVLKSVETGFPDWLGNMPGMTMVVMDNTGAGYSGVLQRLYLNDGSILQRAAINSVESWKFVKVGSSFQPLWSGRDKMDGSAVVSLKVPISAMPNGIMLVFGHHLGNYFVNSFFVPKYTVSKHSSTSHQFTMSSDGKFSTVASKYLTIADESIYGQESNVAAGTGSGITYNNAQFALWYVLGV